MDYKNPASHQLSYVSSSMMPPYAGKNGSEVQNSCASSSVHSITTLLKRERGNCHMCHLMCTAVCTALERNNFLSKWQKRKYFDKSTQQVSWEMNVQEWDLSPRENIFKKLDIYSFGAVTFIVIHLFDFPDKRRWLFSVDRRMQTGILLR